MLRIVSLAEPAPAVQYLRADFAVAGGGLAGVCAALQAARAGLRVVLLHDRPVLGGNASSEVRLPTLGAAAGPNRWAREGGVIDEILVENHFRNPAGDALLFDALLLEKVRAEPTLELLLDTAVVGLEKDAGGSGRIDFLRAFGGREAAHCEVRAPIFCDATGDGSVAFLAGAAFQTDSGPTGAGDEEFAPFEEFGELRGHSIYFLCKDRGRPAPFLRPADALADLAQIPRFRNVSARTDGTQLWWLEFTGKLDTAADPAGKPARLRQVVAGLWDQLKNSGRFPETTNLSLEWVGQVPGERAGRRCEALYTLQLADILQPRPRHDAVAHGGWALDLYPTAASRRTARGVYPIPYRSLVARDVANLLLAGRILGSSRAAAGSVRVMSTLAACAQAVGSAAALCVRKSVLPADLADPARARLLQRELLRRGQHIPGCRLDDPLDLAPAAAISASSTLRLAALPAHPAVAAARLTKSCAQLLPLPAGPAPRLTFRVDVAAPTTLRLELRASLRPGNHNPDTLLAAAEVALAPGRDQPVVADFSRVRLDRPRYVAYCLLANPHVRVRRSAHRLTGVLALEHAYDQALEVRTGVEGFPVWRPRRRPGGQNLAVAIDPPIDGFAAASVFNGHARPTDSANAWLADWRDPAPALTLRWDTPQTLARVELAFDTDCDQPLGSVSSEASAESALPFCVRHYRLRDAAGRVLAEVADNHQTRNTLRLEPPARTNVLRLEILATHGDPAHFPPAAVCEVRCYAGAAS